MAWGRVGLRSGRIEIDREPALLLSGEIQYFRLQPSVWADRLAMAKDAGLDTVASYIPWLWHELPGGEIDLTGATDPRRDLPAFIDLCASLGLRFIARPGPFVMAELKNEGIPYRICRDHPDAQPLGWDGRAASTDDLDYLHPGYTSAAERWLRAVYAILAPRQAPDGPVVGVQLDNEVGMLAWVSNTPHLNDHGAAGLWDWLTAQHSAGPAAELLGLTPADHEQTDHDHDEHDQQQLAAAMRAGGDPNRTLEFHHNLGLWARDRFANYLHELAELARDHGVTVPLLINVHGTGGGRGSSFPIGVSQLAEAYRGSAGMIAGSDYYFGELTVRNIADLYLCNAILACVNGPDQPSASLEFEAGTGDYGDDLGSLSAPESGVHKTLITLGQGNRLLNYYLLAGGHNPIMEGQPDDGISRIGFTGERHGFASPIDPEGRPTPGFAAITEMIKEIRPVEPVLATGSQLTDDLGYGFVADHYLTEYAHPAAEARLTQVAELERYRGFGFTDALGRALVLGGYHFGALDLQALADPDSAWAAGAAPPAVPRTIVLSTGRTLAPRIQQWLVDHVTGGGRLLLTGLLPDQDHHGVPCPILADAFGLSSAGVRIDRRDSIGPYWPTVTGTQAYALSADLRVGSAQLLKPATNCEVLLRELGSGAACAVQVRAGAGTMIFLGCALPAAHLGAWQALLTRLGVERRVRSDADHVGLVTVPVTSPHGNLLIVVNLAPYAISARISIDRRPVADSLTLPARGHALLPWESASTEGAPRQASATVERTSL